jgi:hypothetical protein
MSIFKHVAELHGFIVYKNISEICHMIIFLQRDS